MTTKRSALERVLAVVLVIAVVMAAIPSGFISPQAFAEAAAPENIKTDSESFKFNLKGNGTEEDPYLIENQTDLENMRDAVNIKYKNGDVECISAYYKLTADIELDVKNKVYKNDKGSTYTGWKPIGRAETIGDINSSVKFSGTFDGAGHTISGMYINNSNYGRDYFRGLFGYNTGTIMDLNVVGNIERGGWDYGIIVGSNEGVIKNCSASGKVVALFCGGGIAGYNGKGKGEKAIIENCYSDSTGSGTAVGSLVGSMAGTSDDEYIKNSYCKEGFQPVGQGTYDDSALAQVSESDLISGKVTWLLQNGQESLHWVQNLSESGDKAPKLAKNGDDEKYKVYKVTFMLGSNEIGAFYGNNGDLVKVPEMELPELGYTTGDKWYKNADKTEEWVVSEDTISGDTTIYSESAPKDYTITLELNGGSLVDEKGWTVEGQKATSTYNIESEDFTLPEAKKEGYTFLGWTSQQDNDLTGEAQKEVVISKGTTGEKTFTAVYKDNFAPEITISLGEHKWHALHDEANFDLFYNTSQTVTVSATDNHHSELSIYYYISKTIVEETKLGGLNWKKYNNGITLDPESQYIVYVKVVDGDNNISYASTTGITVEVTKPVISGIANNATYCESANITVADAGLDTITINGEIYYNSRVVGDEGMEGPSMIATVAAVDVQTVTFKPVIDKPTLYTIVATDKAGNSETYTITINGTHNYNRARPFTVSQIESYPSCTKDGFRIVFTKCWDCQEILKTEEVVTEKLGHNWGEWSYAETPNCNDNVIQMRTCKRCRESEYKDLNEKGHDWDSDYTIDKQPTCTEPGSKSIHCKNCDASKAQEELPPLPHTPLPAAQEDLNPATCTTDGSYNEVIRCQECGGILITTHNTIPAKGHSYGEWEEVRSPSCTDSGILQRVCTECNDIDTQNVNEKGHNWENDYTIDKQPTCTEDGSRSVHCADCGATKESEVIQSSGHNSSEAVIENKVEATCTTSGSYEEVIYCTVCNDELSRVTVNVAPVDHDWNDWETLEMPDCDDTGTQQRSCKVCGITEERGLEAAGHEWEDSKTVDVAPTCTTEGSQSIHCKKCNATKDSEVINALGHDWNDWETLEMPDCDDSGTQQRSCKVCGITEEKGLEASGHEWEDSKTVDVAPTCTTEGSQSIHCKKCNATKESEVISALGHDWNEWETLEMPDCDDTGTQQRSCKVCGITEEKGLEAAGHEWEDSKTVDVAPTCTTEGSQSIHCKKCNATKDSEVINALGHDWNDWETLEMPDCDDTGTQQRSCKVCGITEEKGLEASGHEWEDDFTIDKQVTCLEDGSKSIHCKKCDAVKDSQSIPSLGHHTPVVKGQKDPTPLEDGYTGDTVCEVCEELIQKGEVIPMTSGNFEFEAEAGKDVPDVKLSESSGDIRDSVLTDEEKQQWLNGSDVKVILTVTNADGTVTEEEIAVIKAAITDKFQLGQYLEIDMFKYIDDNEFKVTQLNKAVTIQIDVPDALKGENRTFAVVRLHDGEAEILADEDNNADTITFSTDEFSVYAIVYEEAKAPAEPEKPTDTEKPTEPEKPAEPEKPGDTDEPSQPEVPADKDETPDTGSSAVPMMLVLASVVLTATACRTKKANKR